MFDCQTTYNLSETQNNLKIYLKTQQNSSEKLFDVSLEVKSSILDENYLKYLISFQRPI